ncbi:hypothetical protein [Thalassospira marina]|uniref:Uncharacterized protein n=1 Tax=Thalassospira marina TaxID=2048283 RepID=A0A2N3KXU8_9PROT|nr:hypothetical protein [Thalassospira marina]PKR55399.1 hypothetical protein COO20_04310 [Thalassospira marina]
MAELTLDQKKALAMARARLTVAKQKQAGAAGTEDMSALKQGLRGAEMASRGFADSALESVAAIPELVSYGMREAGLPAPEQGFYPDKLKQGWQKAGEFISSPVNEAIGGIGPKEMSTTDRALYGGGRGVADAASVFVPAAGVAKAAKAGSMTQGVARALAAQQGAQMVAGGTGGAVGEATNSPLLGLAAALGTAAAGGVGSAARAGLKNRSAVKQFLKDAPEEVELEDAANVLYDRAKSVPGNVKADSLANFLARAETRLADEGADPDVHSGLANIMNALRRRIGKEPDMKDLQNIRRIAANALDSTSNDERRLGHILVGEIDNFMANLKADDMVSGSFKDAVGDMKDANAIWARLKKTQTIQEAINSASIAGSGFENGLRAQLRSIVNNASKRRQFSENELDMMRRVIQGTPASNTLKKVSKMGFGTGQQSNWLGGILSMGGGYGLGGPTGSLLAPMVGNMAGKQSVALAEKYADLIKAMVASGKPLPEATMSLTPDQIRQQMAAILAGWGKDQALSPAPVPRK